jgi:hypothetical protein
MAPLNIEIEFAILSPALPFDWAIFPDGILACPRLFTGMELVAPRWDR